MTDPQLWVDTWDGSGWRSFARVNAGMTCQVCGPDEMRGDRDVIAFECCGDHSAVRRVSGEEVRIDPGDEYEVMVRMTPYAPMLMRFRHRQPA